MAFRYFGLHPLGELFERNVEVPEDDDAADELEEELNEAYSRVAPDDDAVMRAFERHFAAHRDAYEPGDSS